MMCYVKRILLCCLCLLLLCPAALALDYTQALNQASELGEPENYNVFQPAPEERVLPGLIDGLVAECTYNNSELVITIDSEATDWNAVVAQGLFSGSGEVYISPGFASPTGESENHCSSGFSLDNNPERYIVELLKRDYERYGYNPGAQVQNGMGIGRYDEESELFQPYQTERHGLMCVWEMDGSLQFEYLVTTIRYTSTEPISVKIPKTSAKDIAVLYDMPQSDREKITPTVQSGSVLLEIQNVDLLSQQSGRIAVAFPENAGNDWTCYVQDGFGNGNEAEIVSAGTDGLNRRSAIVSTVYFDSQDSTSEWDWLLEWRDENGKVRSYSKLYIAVVTGDPKPWPYYLDDWKPVDPDRLTIEAFNLPTGVDVVYDGNGLLTVEVETDELPLSADYGRAYYRLFVSPPAENAKLLGRNNSGGSDVFGAEEALDNQAVQLERTRDNAETYEADRDVLGNNIFRTYHQEGSDLTVYMTSEMTGQFAGGVLVLSWWGEDADTDQDEPLLTEYIVTRQESCVRVLKSEPYEDESDLPQLITRPVIVIPQGSIQNGEGMEFVAQIYPQRANNCMYYKLELVDKNGETVKLEKGQYKVFLPYPENLTEEQKNNLNLRHLDDAHIEIENFSINGNTLYLTEGGIWFHAQSFSPFVLEWPGNGNEDNTLGCEHRLGVESAFEDRGFAQFCEEFGEECHLALIELIAEDKVYDGEPYIPSFNYEGNAWLGEEPEILYGCLLEDGTYSEPVIEPPVGVGDYIVFMQLDDLKTMDMPFRIIDPADAPAEHHLVYEMTPEQDGYTQTCADDGCGHHSIIRLAMKSMLYDGGPIIVNLEREGDEWLDGEPIILFMQLLDDGSMNDPFEEPPMEIGDYAVFMVAGDQPGTALQYFSITDPALPVQTELKVAAFTEADLTADLKAAGFDDAWDVEMYLTACMLDKGVKVQNTELYDVALMYRDTRGKLRKASAEHFPIVNGEPKLQVIMELPEDAEVDDEFVVLHMFSSNAFGKTAGEVENPKATIVYVDGMPMLSFNVTGLSPVMVGWKDATVTEPPKTGDVATPALWLALCAISAIGIAATVRKRRTSV